MADRPDCEAIGDLVAELATGTASGDDRAAALTHLAGCPSCRRELDDAARVVDELLTLAPAQEPPPGFEAAVLARLAPRRRPFPRRRALSLVAAAMAAVLAGGLVSAGAVWRTTAADRRLAERYRDTLAVADGRYLVASALYSQGAAIGHVFGYEGSPSWIFVVAEDVPVPGDYQCWAVTRDGRRVWMGRMTVEARRGSWGATTKLSVSEIWLVQLTRPDAPDLLARFRG